MDDTVAPMLSRRFPICRIAGLQPASMNPKAGAPRKFGQPADGNSALQQMGNLRHG